MSPCGFSTGVDSSAGRNTLLEMDGGFDELDLHNQIINTLEEAVELGLVEVSGITPDGQWLYSATEQCRKMLDENRSWSEIAEAIEALGREKDKE